MNNINQMNADLGRMDSLAYDTAFLLRAYTHFGSAGAQAGEWLLAHQLPDGSWGGTVFHAHDRLVSTLAASIALRETGNVLYEKAALRGVAMLPKLVTLLSNDRNDTIGFPLVIAGLSRAATRLDIEIGDFVIDEQMLTAKLNVLIARGMISTASFSLEGALELVSSDTFLALEQHGSVSASPSATIGLSLWSGHQSDESKGWLLHWTNADGGIGMSPIDNFGAAWINDYRRLANRPLDTEQLKMLWQDWSPVLGARATCEYELYDLDTTSGTAASLCAGGYLIQPEVFNRYQMDTHFWCMKGESAWDLSYGAHARLLGALHELHLPADDSRAILALKVLRSAWESGRLVSDKWHISAIYVCSLLLLNALDWDRALADQVATWLLASQLSDGSWGTPEETAYALLALARFRCYGGDVSIDVYQRVQAALARPARPALWIGKGLYNPGALVDSIIALARSVVDEQQ